LTEPNEKRCLFDINRFEMVSTGWKTMSSATPAVPEPKTDAGQLDGAAPNALRAAALSFFRPLGGGDMTGDWAMRQLGASSRPKRQRDRTS